MDNDKGSYSAKCHLRPARAFLQLLMLSSDDLSGSAKNRIKHGLGQSTCERILLARVVRGDKNNSAFKSDLCSMTEGRLLSQMLADKYLPDLIKSKFAEGNDNHDISENFQLADEERTAIRYFVWGWLVGGRGAMYDSRNVAINQFEAVVPSGRN